MIRIRFGLTSLRASTSSCPTRVRESPLILSIGNVLKADITGRVEFTSQLSGMPECKFSINDKFLLQRDKRGQVQKSVNIDDLK